MPATIATYYFDELEDWNHSIDFCHEEIAALTEKLNEVIRRNSIVDIANKVEAQQDSLDKFTSQFHKLQSEIKEQEIALISDSTLADDKSINDSMIQRQDLLRRNMQAAEKEYIDVKYNCHYFLSHLYKA